MHRIAYLASALLLATAIGCASKTSSPAPEAAVEEAAPAEVAPPAEEAGAEEDATVATPKAACEGCAKGKSGESVWCSGCKAGYHGGEKITCHGCWESAQKGETHAHEEEATPSDG
jgi:hypothetical protein